MPASPFAGLLVGSDVLDLASIPDRLAPVRTTLELLRQWDDVVAVLDEITETQPGSWLPLDALTVLPPVTPGQIVQAGANYRTHVLDLAVKHTELSGGRTVEQVRAEAAVMMDERARTGIPYLFSGLSSAITCIRRRRAPWLQRPA